MENLNMSMRASSSTVRRPKAAPSFSTKKDLGSTMKDMYTVFREILSKSTEFSTTFTHILFQKADSNKHWGQLNDQHELLNSLHELQQSATVQLKYLTAASDAVVKREGFLDESAEFVPGDFGKVSELMAATQQQLLGLLKHTGLEDIHVTSKVWELFSSLNVNIWNRCFSGKYSRETTSPGKDFKKKILELNEFNAELKRENFDLKAEIEKMQEVLSQREDEMARRGRRSSQSGERERDSSVMRNELAKSYDRVRALSDEVHAKTQVIERKDQQIAELTSELRKLQKDYQASLYNFENQLDQFRSTSSGFKSPNKSYNTYQSEIDSLREQVTYLKEERDKLMRTSFSTVPEESLLKKIQHEHDREVAKLKEHVEYLRKRVNESAYNSRGARAQSQTRSMNKIPNMSPSNSSSSHLEDQLKKERERSLTLYRALKRKEKECEEALQMAPDSKKIMETLHEKQVLENKVNELHGNLMRLRQDYDELQKIYNLQGEKFKTLKEKADMSNTFTGFNKQSASEDLTSYTVEEIVRPKTSQSRLGQEQEIEIEVDLGELKSSNQHSRGRQQELDEKKLMKQAEKMVISKTLEINQVLGKIEDDLDEKGNKLKFLEGKCSQILALKTKETENLKAEIAQLKQSYDRYLEKHAKTLAASKEESNKSTAKVLAEMEKLEAFYKQEIAKLQEKLGREKLSYENKSKILKEEVEKLKSELKTSEKLAKYNQELEAAFQDQADKIQQLQQHLESSQTGGSNQFDPQDLMELFNIFWKKICANVESIAESLDSLEDKSAGFEGKLSECKLLDEKNKKLNEVIEMLDRNNKENQQNLQNIDRQYKDMIKDLQNENTILKNRYEQLAHSKDSFEDLKRNHEELQRKYEIETREQKDEIDRLKAEAEGKIDYYENKIKNLEDSTRESDSKNVEMVKQLRTQVDKLHKDNAGLEQEFKSAFTEYQEQVSHMDALNKELIDRLNSAELEHTEEIDKLREEIKQISNQNSQLQGEIEKLKDENEELKSDLDNKHTSEDLLNTYQHELNTLKAQNTELTKRNANLEEVYETEVQTLKQKYNEVKNSWNRDLTHLTAQVQSLQKELQDSESKYTQSYQDSLDLKAEHSIQLHNFELEIERLNNLIDQKEAERLEEILQLKIEHETDCDELRYKLETTEEINTELRERIDELKKDLEEKEDRYSKLESDLHAKIGNLERQAEAAKYSQLESELRRRVEELENELEEKEVQSSMVESEFGMKIEDLEKEVSRYRELEYEFSRKVQGLEEEIELSYQKTEEIKDELEERVKILEGELKDRESMMKKVEEQLKLEIQKLEKEIEDETAKRQSIEDQLQQQTNEMQLKDLHYTQKEQELSFKIQALESQLNSDLSSKSELESDLSMKIASLESQLSSSSHQISDLTSQNSTLSKQLADLKTQHKLEISSLSQEYEASREDYEKEIEFFKRETQDLDTNNKELLGKLIQLEKRDADEYKKLMKEYNEFKHNSEEEIHFYQSKLASDKVDGEKIRELEERFNEEMLRFKQENEDLSEQILQAKGTEEKLMFKLEQAIKETETLQKDKHEIESDLQEQIDKYNNLNEKVTDLNQQIQELKDRLQELTEENSNLNSDLITRNEEMDKLLQDLDDLDTAYREKNTQVIQLQDELKDKTYDNLGIIAEIKEEVTTNMSDFWNTICNSFEVYENLLDNIEYSTGSLNLKFKVLTEVIKEAKRNEKKVMELEILNDELNEKLSEMKYAEVSSSEMARKVEEMQDEFDKKMLDYEIKLDSKENEYEMLKEEVETLRSKTLGESDIRGYEDDIDKLKEEISRHKDTIMRLESENSEHIDAIMRLESDSYRYIDAISNQKDEISNYLNTISKLEQEEKSLRIKLQETESDHIKEISDLNKKILHLEADKQSLIEDHEYEITKLTQEIDELNDIIKDLKIENDILNGQSSAQDQEYAEELIRLNRENEELKDAINELKIDNELLDSQNNNSAEAFTKLQTENEDLTHLISELESYRKTLLEHANRLEKQYTEDVSELKAENEELKSQLRLAEARSSKADPSDEHEAEIEIYNQEIENLKASVEELEYENSLLNEKLTAVDQEYADQIFRLKARKQELKQHIAIIEDENARLLEEAPSGDLNYQENSEAFEIEALKQNLKEAQHKIESDAELISALQQSERKHLEETEKLLQQVHELTLTQPQLSDRSSKELFEELQALEKLYKEDISKMQLKFSALEADHKVELVDLNHELESLRSKTSALNKQIADLESDRKKLILAHESDKSSVAAQYSEEIHQLSMNIYDIKQENAQLREKLETLSRENEEFLTSLQAASKYESMYNEQILENEKLSDEIYQLKLSQAERKSADLSNKQMLDEMAALEAKYANKLKRADSEKMDLIEEYENKISSMNDSIAQLEFDKQDLEYKIHSLQDSNLAEINHLKGKIKELTLQYDNLLQHSEEQLSAFNTALSDKDNEIKILKDDIERYQQDSRETNDKLEGETMKLQFEISQLKSERDEKNLELKKLISCYNDTSAALEDHKDLVRELQKKLNLACSSGQELSHDLLEQIKESIQQDMSSFFEDVSNQMEFITYSLENSETKLGELQVAALKTIKQTQKSQDLFTTIKHREQAYSNLLAQHKQLEKLYSDHKSKYDHDVQELIEEYEEKIHNSQSQIDDLTSQLAQAEKALNDQIALARQRESTQQAEDSGSEVISIGESPLISPMKRKSLNQRGLISLSDEEHIDITPIQIPESSKTASPTSTMRHEHSLESASLYDSENGRLFVTINRLQEENHELEDTIQRQNDQMQLLRDEIRNLRGHITNNTESIADPITIKNMVSNLISSLPELPSDSESAIHSLMTILNFDANDKEKCENLRKSRKIVEKVKKGGLKKLFKRKNKN